MHTGMHCMYAQVAFSTLLCPIILREECDENRRGENVEDAEDAGPSSPGASMPVPVLARRSSFRLRSVANSHRADAGAGAVGTSSRLRGRGGRSRGASVRNEADEVNLTGNPNEEGEPPMSDEAKETRDTESLTEPDTSGTTSSSILTTGQDDAAANRQGDGPVPVSAVPVPPRTGPSLAQSLFDRLHMADADRRRCEYGQPRPRRAFGVGGPSLLEGTTGV